MVKFVLDLFKIEKKPLKGLMAIEWAAAAYMLFTFVLIMFFYTKMTAPEAMIYGRLRIIAMTAALWLVYRIFPCKFTIRITCVVVSRYLRV